MNGINKIRYCETCNDEVIHEGDGVTVEAEYCDGCDGVFCPACMDFSKDDNTCKECSRDN